MTVDEPWDADHVLTFDGSRSTHSAASVALLSQEPRLFRLCSALEKLAHEIPLRDLLDADSVLWGLGNQALDGLAGPVFVEIETKHLGLGQRSRSCNSTSSDDMAPA